MGTNDKKRRVRVSPGYAVMSPEGVRKRRRRRSDDPDEPEEE